MRFLVATFLLICSATALADSIPRDCLQYRRDLVRNAREVWGMSAPIATFAGQLHQESACRPSARSAYADGLAQFTPATADWISGRFPELASREPLNPTWALRALVQYDKFLFDRAAGATECDSMLFALWGYNGGEGWVRRDRRLAGASGADPDRAATVAPFNAGRASAMFRENRGYPKAIIGRWQQLYIDAGWGVGSCM